MTPDTIVDEVRQGARKLFRAKGFTLAAVLTLAIGVAGTTVMFSLVNALLLTPLPVRDQDRVIVAWKAPATGAFSHAPFHAAAVEEVRRHARLLEHTAAFAYNGAMQFAIVEDGAAGNVRVGAVGGDFFRVLGTNPLLGRTLEPQDDVSGAELALVIDEGLWRQRYGARPDIIGRRVLLNHHPFLVVGVVPSVDLPRGAQGWMTLQGFKATTPEGSPSRTAAERDHDLVARLRPGVTIEQAEAELRVLSEDFERRISRSSWTLVPMVRGYADEVIGDVRSPVLLLFGAVVLVLLIACANLANLLLMRAEAQRTEQAVRVALGAGRRQLIGQAAGEALALGALAGAVALLIAWWSLGALVALAPTELPRVVGALSIDLRVAAFAVVIAVVTAAVTGMATALLAASADLVSHLRGGRTASPAASHGRRVLVGAQVALSIAILAAAGVLTRTLLQLHAADKGLAADRLVFVELHLPPDYADVTRRRPFLQEVAQQVRAIPGVEAVTPIAVRPYAGLSGWDVPRFAAEGQGADQAAQNPGLDLQSIHPEHFETLEIGITAGRGITTADTDRTPLVAVISEDVARRVWPGQDAIGMRLKMGGVESDARWFTVVGIARTTRYRELAEPRATLYVAAAQFVDGAGSLAIRTRVPVEAIAGAVRDRVRHADPDVMVTRMDPFSTYLARPLARPRFVAWLSNIFGAIALLLAAIGLYGVMAAFVRQRTREIGVRVALGATARDLRRLVLGEAARIAGAGALIGLLGALGTSGLLRGLLFGVEPIDPVTLVGATVVLIATAAIACYLPVRRATRVDAVALLRAD
jgi:putative ABC transport system permease protein